MSLIFPKKSAVIKIRIAKIKNKEPHTNQIQQNHIKTHLQKLTSHSIPLPSSAIQSITTHFQSPTVYGTSHKRQSLSGKFPYIYRSLTIARIEFLDQS